jgi:glycosyltransferase involved in cell wall biosynthesis
MKRPEVSIVMPSFNRLPWLRAAVDSVLAQTHRDWELLLADDGSEAPTREYLRALARSDERRVRVIFREHCGNPPAVRNAALREARGEYVAFLDSDDLWLPGKLERQLGSLRARPGREWSYTAAVMVDRAGEPLAGRSFPYPAVRDGWIADSLLRGEAAVTQSSALVRRAAIECIGGYPEDLPVCGDYELFVRLALRSEVDFVAEDLVLVRRHGEYYSDDIAALRDLHRFIRRVERCGWAPHMAGILRERRVRVAASLTRAVAARVLMPARLRHFVRARMSGRRR